MRELGNGFGRWNMNFCAKATLANSSFLYLHLPSISHQRATPEVEQGCLLPAEVRANPGRELWCSGVGACQTPVLRGTF